MPKMILVGMNFPFSRQQMKRRELEIVYRVYWPTIASIRIGISFRCRLANSVAIQKRVNAFDTLGRQFKSSDRFAERSTRRRTNRRVLLFKQFLSLRRPGH